MEEVTRGLEVAAGARPGSLDEPAGADGESAPLLQRFGYEEPGFGLVDSRDAVSRSLGCLGEREHQVLYMRFFEDLTQSEIAERIGVSQMHVCRILRRAPRALADCQRDSARAAAAQLSQPRRLNATPALSDWSSSPRWRYS